MQGLPLRTSGLTVMRSCQSIPSSLRPDQITGKGSLDAKQDDHVVTIQWSPRRGFGVSASALGDGYGEGPEETFENREHAAARVLVLLRTNGKPSPLRVSCSGSSGDWSELRRRSWRESLAFSRRLSRDSNVATTLRWVHSDAPWPHWERIWRSTFEPRKATAFGLLVPPTRRDRRSRSVPTSVTPPRPAPRPPAPRPGCARPPPAPRGRSRTGRPAPRRSPHETLRWTQRSVTQVRSRVTGCHGDIHRI